MLGGDPANVPPGAQWAEDDCTEPEDYASLIKDAEVVYHCAAAPYEGLSVFSPQIVYQNTLMSTVGVLRASVNAGARRFVFCSSMSRYGAQEAPFTEDMAPSPEDPYAHAKVAAEDITRHLCGLYGMECVIAVPHNIYGPGQRYYDPFRNVVGIMLNRALLGKSLIVYGDGKQVRCFSYISDVTGPFLKLATADVAGEVFNVGPDADEEISINTLADMVRDAAGVSCPVEYYPGRPQEVKHASCSAAKARRLLDYQPEVTLPDGLARYAEWIKQKGARPFEYHLPLEIVRENTPRTWTDRLM